MTSQTENIEKAPVEETTVENAQVETLVNAPTLKPIPLPPV